MDLLFKRYANPFTLMDGYIQTGRLCEFIFTVSKQKKEDDQYEYFLHKIWDKSYAEFCEILHTSQGVQEMSGEDLEATIKKSIEILENFNPEKGEGE